MAGPFLPVQYSCEGATLRNDRTQTFLMQFKSLVVSPDPRSFGRDASNPYYGLLYTVSKELQPKFVVELGTCTGGSTSHLAAGTSGNVLSIDIEIRPDARERLLVFDNVELMHGDTLDENSVLSRVRERGQIDLLFIDTLHTAEQVSTELSLFGPLVRPGGLIFFDDIRMNPGMSAWWDSLEEDKLELPEMHWTGFGVVFR